MSLNMAIYGCLKAGDVLLLPGMEHKGVSRPAADLEGSRYHQGQNATSGS